MRQDMNEWMSSLPEQGKGWVNEYPPSAKTGVNGQLAFMGWDMNE